MEENITLSEFVGYLKSLEQRIENLERQQFVKAEEIMKAVIEELKKKEVRI